MNDRAYLFERVELDFTRPIAEQLVVIRRRPVLARDAIELPVPFVDRERGALEATLHVTDFFRLTFEPLGGEHFVRDVPADAERSQRLAGGIEIGARIRLNVTDTAVR